MKFVQPGGAVEREHPGQSEVESVAEQQLVISSMMLLPIDAAGVLVQEPSGEIHGSIASGDEARLLERVQLETGAGPCLQSCQTGKMVSVEDLGIGMNRWPAFAQLAAKFHYKSVCSLPMRLRGDAVGALNLYRIEAGALSGFDVAVAQALADVAAIGILQERIRARTELVNQQLQNALDSRVVIEQAKGILAERGRIDVNEAFTLLRSHARSTRQRLSELARAVVGGADTTEILHPNVSDHRGIRPRQRISSHR